MNRRWKISLIGLVTVIAAGLVIHLLRSSEPEYQGKPISAWLDDFAAHKGNHRTAICEIGTNVLPYVVRTLARNDSGWRKKYRDLQHNFSKFLPETKPNLQVVDGANVFGFLGSNSIPSAIALLKHDSPSVRQAAAWGFGSLRRQSAAANQAIPALIDALRDNELEVRFHAVLALKEMGADASNAVPALGKILADTGVGPETNSFFYLRAAAATALGKIGPRASSALPALKAAIQESDSNLRGHAAVAIWRIDSEVDTTVPVLLREMPRLSEHTKWDWIIALGEMGPLAQSAIPQLRNELMLDREKWVLEYVTNALIKIDPARFGKVGLE
jgi:hypothetical protein